MQLKTCNLESLLELSDSGTWGDEANQDCSYPVLRSTNIQDSNLVLDNIAWRAVPKSHLVKKRLLDGDVIVTTSSGSPKHIGKCCLFEDPEDGYNYYFSNFTLRLRANPKKLNAKWLHYWLSSPQGRAVLNAMNNPGSKQVCVRGVKSK